MLLLFFPSELIAGGIDAIPASCEPLDDLRQFIVIHAVWGTEDTKMIGAGASKENVFGSVTLGLADGAVGFRASKVVAFGTSRAGGLANLMKVLLATGPVT